MSKLISTFSFLFLLGLSACGGSSGSSGSSPVLSSSQAAIVGNWQVTGSTCNNSSIAYIPSGGSLFYNFNGSVLAQAKTSAGCTQTTTMPYSFDGTTLTVASTSTFQITCAPNPCTGTGLVSSSNCGMSAPLGSSATLTVSVSGSTLTSSESDAQGVQICSSYGPSSVPFSLTFAKH